MIAPVVNHLSTDYFIWASDYPYIEALFGVAKRGSYHLVQIDQRELPKGFLVTIGAQ